jgi:tetratricopeptide (TPR) repeat protein
MMLPQFGYNQQTSIILRSRSRLRGLVCAAALLVPVAFSQGRTSALPKQSPSQIQSPSYDDLVAKALSLLAEKKAKEAAALSEQAMAQNEKRWEAYATAASAYSAQQLYDDSISMLQMALGRAPEGKRQAIRDAITAARRQIAAESAPKVSEPGPRAEPVPAQAVTAQAEAALWKAVENSRQAEDYQGYLSKYPEGTFAPIAKTRLDAILEKQTEEAAKEKKARESNLVGSAWQGTFGNDMPITFKFNDNQTCQIILVLPSELQDNRGCKWQKIGDTLFINTSIAYCGNGAYVLTLKDKTANGVVKIDNNLKGCNGVQVKLNLAETASGQNIEEQPLGAVLAKI